MIIFFDTETTGLAPGRIIQLSYVMLDGERVTAKNFFFYTTHIEYSATMVHGITVEKLATLSDGRTFSEYIDEIDDDFSRADLTVAHNFPFDFKFMTAEFEYLDRRFKFNESFDTMRFFTPILKLPTKSGKGFKHPKLCELAEFFEVYDYDVTRRCIQLFGDCGTSHDARFDVMQTFLAFSYASVEYPEVADIIKKYA